MASKDIFVELAASPFPATEEKTKSEQSCGENLFGINRQKTNWLGAVG